MARNSRRRRRPPHRAGRFLGVYIFLSVILITAVVVAGCIVFFKVNQFEVQGNDRYSKEQVVEASGVDTGDNLCLVDKSKTAANVIDNLPYVNTVNVRRSLPDTVVITVTETDAVAAVQGEDGWWLISVDGKLLEEQETAGDHVTVTGLPLVSPKAGDAITVEADYRLMRRSVIELLTAMQSRDHLDKLRSIRCEDDAQMVMDYDGRLQVRLLSDADYDYQVKMLEAVLEKYVNVNWTKEDTGTLDMTYEDGHPHLTKDKK